MQVTARAKIGAKWGPVDSVLIKVGSPLVCAMCHNIIFTELHYNALSGSKIKSEFVEIYNYGTVPQLMTGAVLARYSGGVPTHNYTFPTVTIQPKSYYVISFFKEVWPGSFAWSHL